MSSCLNLALLFTWFVSYLRNNLGRFLRQHDNVDVTYHNRCEWLFILVVTSKTYDIPIWYNSRISRLLILYSLHSWRMLWLMFVLHGMVVRMTLESRFAGVNIYFSLHSLLMWRNDSIGRWTQRGKSCTIDFFTSFCTWMTARRSMLNAIWRCSYRVSLR